MCNGLRQYMEEDDELLCEYEQLVREPKTAVEIQDGRRLPGAPDKFKLRVKASNEHSRKMTLLALKAGGRIYLDLITESGLVVRQYHLDYSGHGNPNGSSVGKSHKHFPTRRYPLRSHHHGDETCAYAPEPFPHDFIEAVKTFCSECNIAIESLGERLEWFR